MCTINNENHQWYECSKQPHAQNSNMEASISVDLVNNCSHLAKERCLKFAHSPFSTNPSPYSASGEHASASTIVSFKRAHQCHDS
eukprot:c8180_g1_i1 orf=18-272(-)